MTDLQFQDEVVDKIEGWLVRVASLRTMDILTFQEENQITGPLLEIGVFCGKYFSVLARSAQRRDNKLLGVDTFQWAPESRVRESLALSPETKCADVTLWKRCSHECSAREITEHLDGRPRFISIDGSHECEDVYLDIDLSEQIISSRGVIAVDDFLNSATLGVNEAVHKFFARPRWVVPFAFIANKLFLTHRSMASQYRVMIEQAIMRDETEPECRDFREEVAKARTFVEQPLWGHTVLLC